PEDYRAFLLQYNGGGPAPCRFTCEMEGEEQESILAWFFAVHDHPDKEDEDWDPNASDGLPGKVPVDASGRRRLHRVQDGVGFTVYQQEEGIERVWPMDPVPRIIPAHEWRTIERGLAQRLRALNLFLKDVYHEQFILHDRVVDPQLVYEGAYFRREFLGAPVP